MNEDYRQPEAHQHVKSTATGNSSESELSDLLALSRAKIKLTGDLSNRFGYEADELIIVHGAITTKERFSDFTESLCHLSDDGIIRRLGREIGSFKDIETLEC